MLMLSVDDIDPLSTQSQLQLPYIADEKKTATDLQNVNFFCQKILSFGEVLLCDNFDSNTVISSLQKRIKFN